MKKLTYLIAVLSLFATLGCDGGGNGNEKTAEPMSLAAEMSPKADSKEQDTERKLIKEGFVTFETDNLSVTRGIITQAVSKCRGYISSDEESRYPGRVNNTVVVRVPADKFDALLAEATAGVEHFESKNINVKDVTEEFLDISARLTTKKELEARFLDLLKQAKTVTEILEIETQLGQLRADIESIEGRLKYLESQVSFSTLTITFYETYATHTQFGTKFNNAFRNGWNNLILFFVFLANLWPFVLIIIGLTFGIKAYRRRKN